MRIKYISLNVYHLSFEDLAQLAENIISSMITNVNYLSPVPSMPTLSAILAAYRIALKDWGTKGNHGSSQHHRVLLSRRTELQAALTQLAFYAESTTPGDKIKLGTVKWPLIKDRQAVGILQQVRNLRQFISRKVAYGTIKLRWNKPEDTKGVRINNYLVMRAPENDFSKALYIQSVTKTTFTDVNPLEGVNYYWVIPVGAAGNGIVSSICPAIASQLPC